MTELSFRKRHRLKGKEVKILGRNMEGSVGIDMLSPLPAVDRARGLDMDYLLVDGRVAFLVLDDVPFPSLRTLLDKGLDSHWAEVDEGAVRFLANGADCMAPGVTDAAPDLEEGAWVYVRDAQYRRPLVVGKSLMTGPDMVAAQKGKAVGTLHYVGDKIWDFE